MSYHALARKFRPATFAEVVGQEHVTNTLRAALRKDKLSHAYLFSGSRGCGKTTVARLLAKALNCGAGQVDEPCGACEICRGIAAVSYLVVREVDAASHTGVGNGRDLRDMAQFTPSQGSNRVFIIDEVHMLSKGAFNALLKILEEPPARVFFFFATTEPNRIPRTILSRCQRFDFRLLTRDELSGRVNEIVAAEGKELDAGALRLIVAQAEGSMRDALSILDQVLAACDGVVDEQAVVDLFGLVRADVFTGLNEAILDHDPARVLQVAEQAAGSGRNLDDFARELVDNFRHLLLLRIDPDLAAGILLPEDQVQILLEQSRRFAVQDLLALLERASRGFERIHRSTQPRVLLEALLVELSLLESRVLLSDLVRRLEALTGTPLVGGAGGGAAAAPGGGQRRSGGTGGGASRAREAAPAATVAPAEATADATDGPEAYRAAAASTVSGWASLVEGLLSRHPALGACIMEGMPSVDGERVVLTFPAEKTFQLRQVQQDFEILQKASVGYLGKELLLNVVKGEDEVRSEHREELRRTVAPTENEALKVACGMDETLGDLVSMLDAEAVPDAEREDWLRRKDEAPPAEES
ncbi:DNA polymerase III subunit gamma/tau [bacterium]|nr:DNA polymerase III subunit gamma/tau [bacterium]